MLQSIRQGIKPQGKHYHKICGLFILHLNHFPFNVTWQTVFSMTRSTAPSTKEFIQVIPTTNQTSTKVETSFHVITNDHQWSLYHWKIFSAIIYSDHMEKFTAVIQWSSNQIEFRQMYGMVSIIYDYWIHYDSSITGTAVHQFQTSRKFQQSYWNQPLQN